MSEGTDRTWRLAKSTDYAKIPNVVLDGAIVDFTFRYKVFTKSKKKRGPLKIGLFLCGLN